MCLLACPHTDLFLTSAQFPTGEGRGNNEVIENKENRA